VLQTLLVLGAISISGDPVCPSRADVEARLAPKLKPRRADWLHVELADRRDELRLTLWSPSRELLALRVVPFTYACDDLAERAAVIIAAWSIDFSGPLTDRTELPPVAPRVPLAVGAITQPGEAGRPFELFVAASFGLASPRPAAAISVDTTWAKPHALTFLGGASLEGPLPVAIDRSYGWALRASARLGVAWREEIGAQSVDFYARLPVSVLLPKTEHQAVLGGLLKPAALLSVECGVRVSFATGRRFAPFVAVGLDVPLVNSGSLQVAPFVLAISAGVVWRSPA
jgi:hypothetical protein